MKGICFKEEMFNAVISGRKTQTRRVANSEKPKYKKGETLFLKEPYAPYYYGLGCIYKYGEEKPQATEFKNKLFMPEKYARFFIEILEVRREKLQEITDRDAIAEGIAPLNMSAMQIIQQGQLYKDYHSTKGMWQNGIKPIESFTTLWNSIHTKEHTWKDNPDVFVYEFKLVTF